MNTRTALVQQQYQFRVQYTMPVQQYTVTLVTLRIEMS